MNRKLSAALLALVIAACGRDGGMTEPMAPLASLPTTPGVLALGTDPVSGASIETNKDDYTPGEVVHVVGRGWGAGETVNLHMTEDPDSHADVDTNVVADASGGFSVHYYDVQIHDIGVTFTLTATGMTSGSRAVTTFTDGNVSVQLSPAGVPSFTTGSYVKYTGSGNTSCTPGTTDVGSFSANASSGTVVVGINQNQSLKLTVPATLTGYTFSSWSVGSPAIHVSGSLTNAADLCIRIPSSSDQPLIIANYVAAPTNVAPVIDAGGPYSGAEGSGISLGGPGGATATDGDGDALTYKWTISHPNIDTNGSCSFSPSDDVLNPSVTCTDDSQDGPGTFTLTLEVKDGAGGHTVTDNAVLTVTNANPTANAGGPYSGDEGSAIQLTGSGNDAGSNDVAGLTYAWSVNSSGIDATGSCTFSDATISNPTITCTDDSGAGNFTVSLTVSDDDLGVSTASTVNLDVDNVPPTIGLITAPLAPVALGTNNVTVSWLFTDPGADVWTCSIQWDAGLAFTSATYVSSPRGCTATASLTPGLYTVTVKVSDDDGGEDAETLEAYIVVYDPNGGFVTGGGWIMSPAGAYVADENLTGKANFGFVSKYQQGKTTPQGNTEFQFHAGNLNFKSTTYEWLVVAGTRAQFKGVGTINGAGNYGFLLTAIDGSPDKFRIKIVDKSNGGAVVYDNQPGALEDSPAATDLGGGSIVIHTKK
ncbi:MAG TPA: hypothetical protein VF128_16250 [Gemmatimonadaceae bacterium]